MKCKWCGEEITEKRRKVFCSNKCYRESRREKHKKPKEEIKAVANLKKKEVCKGCKYRCKFDNTHYMCNYLEMTGKSRALVEIANGGVKTDGCCCYESGKKTDRKKALY